MNCLKPYEYQVAGHLSGNFNSRLGFLQLNDFEILKPLIKESTGKREREFYTKLSTSKDAKIAELKSFVPVYYGTIQVHVQSPALDCLVLENLTQGCTKPCVIDIKMGEVTWEPSADRHKIATELSKYSKLKRKFGFFVTGCRFFDMIRQKWTILNKDDCKSLNESSLISTLKSFFNIENEIGERETLLLQTLNEELEKILRWFWHQDKFLFYSSSLLIIYDASQDACTPSAVTLTPILSRPHRACRVKMIDFAHTLDNTSRFTLDHNYIRALENLIIVLKNFRVQNK